MENQGLVFARAGLDGAGVKGAACQDPERHRAACRRRDCGRQPPRVGAAVATLQRCDLVHNPGSSRMEPSHNYGM